MILIFSEDFDKSTNIVFAWIYKYDKDIYRFNDNLVFETIEICGRKVSLNGFDLDKCHVIWDRRGDLKFHINNENVPINLVHILNWNEWFTIRDYIFFLVEKKGIGSFKHEATHNKLTDLYIAQSAGFSIPKSFVVSEKIKLQEIIFQYQIITKPIKNVIYFEDRECKYIYDGTKEVKQIDIDMLPNSFFPMLFQEKIEKLFEIRVFYWLGDCYAMAIFSQLDEKTCLDYRNYNKEKPNRNVPFKLPKNVEQQIRRFMHKKELKSGSIDIIYSSSKEFVFLEVNPCGQFDWLSANCNYYLNFCIK